MIIPGKSNTLEDVTDQFYRIFCGLCFIIQSTLINYFLIYLSNDPLHFLWIIADVVIMGVMIYAFVLTYLRKRRPCKTHTRLDKLLEHDYPGELPFAYIIWLVYSVGLIARLAIIYKLYATKLTATNGILSSSALNVSIGLSVGNVYFLVRSLSLRNMHEMMKQAVERWIVAEEALNILDAIDLLGVLFSATVRATFPTGLEDAVIGFGLIMLIFPVFHFSIYATTKYESTTRTGRVVKAIFSICGLFICNLPLAIIRFILWLSSSVAISAFLIKNVLFIYIYIVQLVNAVIERAPESPRKTRRAKQASQPQVNYGFSPRPLV